ncbi:MAG TPA: hypothetical protein VGE63_00455 [Candidatus Paceibacterota bacterium]
MKKTILITAGVIFVVVLGMVGFKKFNHRMSAEQKSAQNFRVSERYEGIINGDSVVFEHQNMTSYRLTTLDTATFGELNVERGWEDDQDATVFVLDWRKAKSKQQYFVRLTDKPNQIQKLDSERKLIENAILQKKF